MRLFRNLSIGSKLTIITVFSSGVALLIACVAFAVYEHNSFREATARDLQTMTGIFDKNVASGLAFNDVASMEQTLGTLNEDARILAAAVYDRSGAIMATYQRADQDGKFLFPTGLSIGQRLGDNRIDTFREIELAGEIIGVVYIGADTSEITERAWRYLIIVAFLLVACSFVAFALASRLQKFISRPISALAETTDSIAAGQDYGRRAVKHGEDEVGRLVDGFNNMLAQIQARDAELQAANNSLEQRVEERTAALVQQMTEREQAEADLARSHSVINATLESTLDGILVVDKNGRVKHFNRRFAEMWRVTPDHLATGSNRSVLAFVSKQLKDPNAFVRKALSLFNDPTSEDSDVVEFQDGRILELYTRPQHFDGVSIDRIWCFRDITERKRAEAVITYERDLLQTLMDSLPDHLYFKDLGSCFVRFSQSKLADTLTFLRERHGEAGPLPPHLESREALQTWLQGRTDFDLLGEDAEPLFAEEQEIIRTGQPVAGKIELVATASGDNLWFLVTKMPWRDAQGRIIGTYGISKNITDIKDAEQRLKEAHEQLVTASRQAGMAEVATGVLHNVGNVLNSVNVSATLVRETLRNSEVATLGRVADLLKKHNSDLAAYLTDDPKGRLVPNMVIQLADHLAGEHATLRTEHEHLAKNVEHIKGIVAMQQNYATVSGVLEKGRIADLLGDVLQMHAVSFTRDGIEIVREYAELPSMVMDKHKVMQILVNLVTNAKHALGESGRTDGRITVVVAMHGRDRVRVSISDNGVGIPAENLTRIFSHGFTTRANGHGFGLHSGAIAAREMGGSLKVESAGAGTGATFTLELPLDGRSQRP